MFRTKLKHLRPLSPLLLVLAAPLAHAMPMLSTDGTLLSNLDVNGVLYDVTFGNSIASERWQDVVFDAAREVEANAVSDALVLYFNTPGNKPYRGILKGCANALNSCMLFNPDTLEDVIRDGEVLYTRFVDRGAVRLRFGDPYARLSGNWGASPWSDSRNISSVTHLSYSRSNSSAIPIPSSALLLLIVLPYFRQKKGKPPRACLSQSYRAIR